MKLTASAVRSGGWWALDIDYGDGLWSQVRRLEQASSISFVLLAYRSATRGPSWV